MSLHNPVEDAQREAFQRNPRGRQALDVARAFLQAPDDDDRVSRRPTSLPGQAAPIAGQRAFGQQGAVRRRQPTVGVPTPVTGGVPVAARQPGGFGPGNIVSPIDTFLREPAVPNRALLSNVMQRLGLGTGRRF